MTAASTPFTKQDFLDIPVKDDLCRWTLDIRDDRSFQERKNMIITIKLKAENGS